MSEDTRERLDSIAKSVSKRLGSDDFMGIVSDNELAGRIGNWVSTGNYAIDYICSGKFIGGGLPVGRVVEVFGPPATGKSLLLYHFLVETQKRDGLAVLLETEGAYNRDFGATIGIDNDKLLLGEPDTVEQVFAIVDEIANTVDEQLITIVWDSIAQTSTDHEMDVDIGVVDMSKAKMIKAGFRRIGRKLSKANVLFVAANHIISKIGVMYGKKTTEPGGRGYAFASSIRLELTKKKSIVDVASKEIIGTNVGVFVEKNKVAPPFKRCEVEIYFDRGVDEYSGMLEHFVNKGLVEKSGGWYSYGGEKFRSSEFKDELFEKIIESQEKD